MEFKTIQKERTKTWMGNLNLKKIKIVMILINMMILKKKKAIMKFKREPNMSISKTIEENWIMILEIAIKKL